MKRVAILTADGDTRALNATISGAVSLNSALRNNDRFLFGPIPLNIKCSFEKVVFDPYFGHSFSVDYSLAKQCSVFVTQRAANPVGFQQVLEGLSFD